jgi:integrase
MRGQVISRGKKTWLLRVSLGRDASGKRRTFNETFHGTKKAADTRLTNILNQRDNGTFVEPSSITLSEYLDRWLEDAAKGSVRSRTHAGYTDILTRYVRPELGQHHLSRITPLDIQAIYTGLRDRKLSPRTIRYVHAVLRSALNQAVKWRLLPHNPAMFVDLPRLAKKEMHALSPEQAMQFLAAAAQDRYATLFAVALTTGMRPGEYLGLQWKDVDLERGTLTVRRTLVWHYGNGGKWSFEEPKTARSSRSIPLPPSVVDALKEHKRQQGEERLKAGWEDVEENGCLVRKSAYTDNDLVFATPTGDPVDMRNLVNRHFKPILKRAGLPKSVRLYDLRHSCATLLLAQGEHPKVVSERLGHASITLTLDTYSHVLPTMQQQAAERLESVLFKGRK